LTATDSGKCYLKDDWDESKAKTMNGVNSFVVSECASDDVPKVTSSAPTPTPTPPTPAPTQASQIGELEPLMGGESMGGEPMGGEPLEPLMGGETMGGEPMGGEPLEPLMGGETMGGQPMGE